MIGDACQSVSEVVKMSKVISKLKFGSKTLFVWIFVFALAAFWFSIQRSVTLSESNTVSGILAAGGHVGFSRSKFLRINSVDRVMIPHSSSEAFSFETIKKLKHLKSVTLRKFESVEIEVGVLLDCPQITSFSFCDCVISPKSLSNVVSGRNIENLILHGSSIGDEHLKELSFSDAKIKYFLLIFSRVTDEGLGHVIKLRELRELALLSNDRISDPGYLMLADAKTLQILEIGSSEISPATVIQLAASNELKELRIVNSTMVVGQLLRLTDSERMTIVTLNRKPIR